MYTSVHTQHLGIPVLNHASYGDLIHTKYLSIGHSSEWKLGHPTLINCSRTAACVATANVATAALCQGYHVLLYHYLFRNSTYSEIDVMPWIRPGLSQGDQGRHKRYHQ